MDIFHKINDKLHITGGHKQLSFEIDKLKVSSHRGYPEGDKLMYTLYVNNVKLKCSQTISKKIFIKVKSIHNK